MRNYQPAAPPIKALLLLSGAALLCCSVGLEPLNITLDEETCSYCRMTVSQLEFAAESVGPGSVDYFDDIGCLVRWLEQGHAPGGAVLYVVDFETGAWLKAEEAHFAQSGRLPTPMQSGLAAYAAESGAAAAASRLQGRVLSWGQLPKEVEP